MRDAPPWGSQLRQAFAEPNLRRLMVVWGVWVVADWVVLIATGVLAYQVGGVAGIGLIGVARALPGALLSGFASIATDRLSRPRLLAACQAMLCVASVITVWIAVAWASLAALAVVIGVTSVVAAVLRATIDAMVPQVVSTPGELIVANSAMSTVEALGTVVGPVACGVLLSLGGASWALMVPVAIYAVGAVVARSIVTEFQPARSEAVGIWQRVAEPLLGFPELVRPKVRIVIGLFALQVTMRGLINVFVVVLAITMLGGEGRAGTLFAAIGVGGLVAALVVLGAAPQAGVRWFAVGIALWGLPVIVIGLWPNAVVAWVALAALGVGNALGDIFGYTQMSRLFRDHVAGRAWGAFGSLVAGGVAIGSVVAPILIVRLGLESAMIVTGAVVALAPLLVWPWLRRLQEAVDTETVALLGEVELLEPLPHLVLERLATASREQQLVDSQFAVREGEVGDVFYVVASGEMSVQRQGQQVRTLGPGDGFGEIALLRDVPRTASVCSVGPSTLRLIDRGAFMAAVTGHIGASQSAHTTADHWLSDDADRERVDRPDSA